MKRLYIAIAFLLTAIMLCTFEQYTINSTYKKSTQYIDKAMAAVACDNYDDAQESCRKLSQYWNKKYPYMTAMIEHGPLDDASVTINSLDELAENKSDELENELIHAKNQVKIIYDNQRISFGNIF